MFNIILLGLVSFLTDVSSEMVYPLVPLFLTLQLGATPAIVGVIEGLAESTASLLKVFSGYWSDRLGRRKPLAITGYALSTLGKGLFYLSTSWGWVLGGRLADRFGKGVRTAPRDALIADSSDPRAYGLSFGLHRAMDTFGAVAGVAAAYFLLRHAPADFRPVFLYAVIPAAIGVFLLFFVREKRDRRSRTAQRLSLNWRELDPRLKAFLVVVFLFTLGNSSNQFLLLRAQNLGFLVRDVLLLYLVYVGVYGLLAYPAGRLSDRVGRRRLLVWGYLTYGLVYLGFALVQQPETLWPLFAAYGLYSAATEGVEKALVAEIAPAHQRGTLIGLHATLVGIGLLPASLFAGLLWKILGPAAPFYFGGAMGVLTAAALAVVLRRPAQSNAVGEGS
ncbi:MAG: MFS transporter [Bacillota bacterium]|jgi:MFS family permease